jgi:predicted PurR-regulated permease PerM
MNDRRVLKIEITHRTIFFILGIMASAWLIVTIKDIIIAFFVSILIATAVHPSVRALQRRGVPKAISAAVLLMVMFFAVASLIASVTPLVIGQVNLLFTRLPKILEPFALSINVKDLASQIAPISTNIVKVAVNTFSGSVFVMTILFISFYIIVERDNLEEYLKLFLKNNAKRAEDIITQIEIKLGYWVRGELLLMLIVGVMTYIGLILIGLDYALPLAVIAGFLELIPNIGPTLSSVPAILVGFSISPVHGLLTIALYVLVQQLENNLIVPQIMRKTIGLHPVITIIALMIGFRVGGALLAILSLPIVLVIQVLIQELNRSDSKIKLI